MKKLLLIAFILAVGCGRYEDTGEKRFPYSCSKRSDTRFDNWFDKTTYNVNGKWYTKEQWEKTATYKALKKCRDDNDYSVNEGAWGIFDQYRDCKARVDSIYCP
jgi:hypothetical protein|tara:strand:- start:57 stop:368 length:312 start_codon:yes stop_codon:yes gene_type:complete